MAAIGATVAESRVGGQYSAPLVTFLAAKTAGFKISNFNILKAVMQTMLAAAQNTGRYICRLYSVFADFILLFANII